LISGSCWRFVRSRSISRSRSDTTTPRRRHFGRLPTRRHVTSLLHLPFLPTTCAYLVHGEPFANNKPKRHRNDYPGCIRNQSSLQIRGIFLQERQRELLALDRKYRLRNIQRDESELPTLATTGDERTCRSCPPRSERRPRPIRQTSADWINRILSRTERIQTKAAGRKAGQTNGEKETSSIFPCRRNVNGLHGCMRGNVSDS
jgi:hypothetical protein